MSQEQRAEEATRDRAASGWPTRRLRKISAFISKGSTPTTYGFKWERAGVLFLRSECVSDRGLDLTQSMFISEQAHATLRRSEATDGDILITITGNVGRVVRLKGVDRANMNQHIARIRVTAADAEPEFVFQVLAQPAMRAYFASITTGQAYPQISLVQVRDAEVPFPPLEEQRAVSEALGDVDALLAKLDQLIAKKRNLKQAAMQQLLTGRLRLQGFTGRWDDRNLAGLGSLLKGRGVTRDQANSGSIACVRYGEIYTTHHDIVRAITSWISPAVAATATRLKRGDILFAGSGETKEEIGKCVAFIDDFEAYAGGDIVILRPRGVDSRFLGYALNTPEVNRQKANFGQGDAVVHISAAALGNVTVRLPPLDEQVAIGTVLADMDTELAALEARREKTRQLKQGMMQALLSGRIRLV